METKTPLSTRLISAILCGAVLLACPGPSAYAAAGQIVSVQVNAPVSAPVGAGLGKTTFTGTLDARQTGLTTSLSGILAPAPAAPTVSVQDISAPQTPVSLAAPALFETVAAPAAEGIRTVIPAAAPADSAKIAPAETPEGGTVAQAESIAAEPGRLAAPASRVRTGIIGTLKSLFSSRKNAGALPAAVDASPAGPVQISEKSAATLTPSAPTTQADGKKASLPAPAADDTPKPEPGANRWATFFIVSLVVAQVGLEAFSASYGQWVKMSFGVDKLASLQTISLFASLAAGYIGGVAADKLGLKVTYIGASLLGAACTTAILMLFSWHMLPFAALAGLAAFRTVLGTMQRTAEQTIPISIFKGNKDSLEKFNSISQFILEFAGIGVPFAINSLLGVLGFAGTMWIFPVTVAAAMLIFGVFTKVPDYKPAQKKTAAPTAAERDPVMLKLASLAYPAFVLMNVLLYSILALGYGNYISPGNDALAAGITGKIVSLYSFGGLLAAAFLSGIPQAAWAWLKKVLGKDTAAPRTADLEPAAAKKADLKNLSLWVRLGALGLLGFVPFLFANPLWAFIAMVPFGITSVMAQLKTLSQVQANVPPEKKGKVMGGLRTAMTLAAAVGTFAFGQLFKFFPASTVPFMIMLGVLGGLAAFYLWIAARISRHEASIK
ncbi:MAG: MFS transporter [Elusimicrobia bacterium]|nr:MFS transporter [Elusimicrobiota bacterium]